MATISVLIPVYNTQAYIKECLDSLLSQDFQDWEAVCVNDGSTDDSLNILNEYAQKDIRFKVISQENKGLASTRNVLLDHATSPWQLFLDSDDLLVPQALSTLYRVAQESKQPVVVPHAFGSIGQDIPAPHGDYRILTPALKSLLKTPKIYSSTCGKLYHADALKKYRFIPGIYFEDWPFITILFSSISGFAVVNDELYLYRQTQNSIVRSSFSIKKIDSYIAGITKVNEELGKTNYKVLAQKRCSIAIRMCINKVWRDKEHHSELVPHLAQQVHLAHQKGYFLWRFISPKTIMRFIIMKYFHK